MRDMILSVLFLTLLFGLSTQTLNYNANRGLSAAYYSAAAYCAYETLDNWSCGTPCTTQSGVSSVTRIHNTSDNTFAYVAYDKTHDEIVIAFRGSNGLDFENWATNLDFVQRDYKDESGCKVHGGFHEAYEAVSDEIIAALQTQMTSHSSSNIMITGHSLGGALATLCALDVKRKLNPSVKVFLYSFGSPRVGNDKLADYIMTKYPNGQYSRVTHYDDMIAHVPAQITGFQHGGNEVWYSKSGTDLTYSECENNAGSNENGKCSNSLWLKTGIDAHLSYLGIAISKSCTTKQPSGTLTDTIEFQVEPVAAASSPQQQLPQKPVIKELIISATLQMQQVGNKEVIQRQQ